MHKTIVKACEVSIGDQIPEEDGFLFDVIDVEEISETEVELTLASDFSSIPKHWACNGGVTQKFSKQDQLYVVR